MFLGVDIKGLFGMPSLKVRGNRGSTGDAKKQADGDSSHRVDSHDVETEVFPLEIHII